MCSTSFCAIGWSSQYYIKTAFVFVGKLVKKSCQLYISRQFTVVELR